MDNIAIFWFSRNLRLDDNVGLYHALSAQIKVLPIFTFDTTILSELEKKIQELPRPILLKNY